MANQIQKVMYEGYLADDPIMRFTPAGTAVTNFRMGSNRQWKGNDGNVNKETTWLKVAVWGEQAEIVNNYCEKGSHVIVEGRLKPNANGSPETFQLKNGEWVASFEITAIPYGVRILKGKPFENERVEEEDSLPY